MTSHRSTPFRSPAEFERRLGNEYDVVRTAVETGVALDTPEV
jgi:hypothetical protein